MLIKKKSVTDLLIPQEILSTQQKQIYIMHSQGLSNKKVAENLNIEPRAVATQLSRIRKKAAKLKHTYKIEPRTEYAQNPAMRNSPADQLKKKIRDDPGFFKLMFQKYATEDESLNKNKYMLASATQDPALLFNTRVKQIKAIVASGSCSSHDKVVIKIDKRARQMLREYLIKEQIRPLQSYWDDGSAVYQVTISELENMKHILKSQLKD
ncbi:MAG: sigma-70 region 4 domain-containing protein [Desulfotomaculaceae bacterium]|nr:sigma-70 region 4 domain-containing protein [Desulfotomaculaceae bacterium]